MRRFTFLHRSPCAFLCVGLIPAFLLFAVPAGESYLGEQPTLPQLSSAARTGWGTPPHSERITLLLKRAVDDGLISGGVVLVGNSRGVLSVSTLGRLGVKQGHPLSEDNLFDIASLTKVVATAPAVMKLVDDRALSLSDPLSRWFPEFRGSRHADITVLDLLTHTSGLADLRPRRGQSLQAIIRKAAAERVSTGRHHFNYADINFILLGELVRRVSGKPLDIYCREKIFLPLGMRETMFRPPENMDALIAPTAGVAGGVVQDLTARRLGRVAGHAGLFSSARDLSRFARLMMGGGELDGRRYFSQSAILQMTSPRYIRADAVSRGLGWDISSRYSAPKSRLFSERSFGHTGYSGSSIWIDPQGDLFVILLTVRQNYRSLHIFNLFRENVSTVAASEYQRSDSARQNVSRQELSQIGSELSHWERQRQQARLHSRPSHHRGQRADTRLAHQHPVRTAYLKGSGKSHRTRNRA
jgi:CubicO group peptidase (beta-lactamase class C family)